VREKHRLNVLEKRVPRKTFGHKRDEVTGEWRSLRYEDYDLHCSPYIIRVTESRRMRWAGHVASMGERERCGQEKKKIGRHRRRWENIKMDL
jgi:hypothetical protein